MFLEEAWTPRRNQKRGRRKVSLCCRRWILLGRLMVEGGEEGYYVKERDGDVTGRRRGVGGREGAR